MRFSSVFAMAFGVSLGCTPEPETADDLAQVYWIEAAPAEGVDCPPAEITENFELADAIGTFGPVTESRQATESGSGQYALVTRNEAGSVWVSLLGEVLVGETLSDGSIEVGWVSEENVDEVVEDGGYAYTRSEQRSLERVLTLAVATDIGEATGTLRRTERLLIDLVEVDQWIPELAGPSQTLMSETRDYLDWTEPLFGAVDNDATEIDCVDGQCELRVSADCTTEQALTAFRLEGGVELFEALEGYERAPGPP